VTDLYPIAVTQVPPLRNREAPLRSETAGLLLIGVDNPLSASTYPIVVGCVPLAHHRFPATPRRNREEPHKYEFGASS